MRKEKRKIEIGEEFVANKNFTQEYYESYKTLRECYGRWSDAKENIFNYYKKLLEDNSKVIKYGIRSYNANVITLHAEIEKDNKKYYLVITPSHNWYNEI